MEIFGNSNPEEEDEAVIQQKQATFKEKLNGAIKFMNFMVGDHLHNATSVDVEGLNKNLQRLNLSEDTDPEFASLIEAY